MSSGPTPHSKPNTRTEDLFNKNIFSDMRGDDWMITYSDLLTLLLAFFVLLVAISDVDMSKFEAVRASIQEGLSDRDIDKPIEVLQDRITQTFTDLNLDEATAAVAKTRDGIVIQFASGAFYDPGSATPKPLAAEVLSEVAETLNDDTYSRFMVVVEGHTDDVPIRTAQFPSNWELSSARASGVVRLFIDAGVQAERLRAVGLGEIAPRVPNRGPDGQALAANQEINRRIEVHIRPRLAGDRPLRTRATGRLTEG